jgi:hypothetical protein
MRFSVHFWLLEHYSDGTAVQFTGTFAVAIRGFVLLPMIMSIIDRYISSAFHHSSHMLWRRCRREEKSQNCESNKQENKFHSHKARHKQTNTKTQTLKKDTQQKAPLN